MNKNKDKMEVISSIIGDKIKVLNAADEDILLINQLVTSYYRKRTGISNSASETIAAAFLWVYSKSNFLWEGDKKWSCQGLAELFNANPKTVGAVASKIINSLKINLWDERFCRQNVMKNNPFDEFVMTKSGFIVPKEMLELPPQYSEKRKNTKENYFDEAMNYLEQNEEEKAIEHLNKSLALDENYIEAINELGFIYFDTNINKSKEYYKKAAALSKKELGGEWPGKLEWGVWENRPYLRAIQGLALIHWREYEIEEAKELFSFLLKLNPSDNQGIRYCMAAIYKGLTWEDFGKIEDRCAENGEYEELDNLLIEQNNEYKFWKTP
ncbi:MAG: tetratricopeptide repeat protein [Nanoarchaeota archaeon]